MGTVPDRPQGPVIAVTSSVQDRGGDTIHDYPAIRGDNSGPGKAFVSVPEGRSSIDLLKDMLRDQPFRTRRQGER